MAPTEREVKAALAALKHEMLTPEFAAAINAEITKRPKQHDIEFKNASTAERSRILIAELDSVNVTPKRGMQFVHEHWMNEDGTPEVHKIFAIRKGIVYYGSVTRKKSEWYAPIAEFPKYVRRYLTRADVLIRAVNQMYPGDAWSKLDDRNKNNVIATLCRSVDACVTEPW